MVDKGILLEVDGRSGVVLTPQGEFRRVRIPSGTWDVGDEIEIAAARPVAWRRWALAAAAVLALVLLPVGYRSWVLAQPMAMVTIDINPSLELTLDQRERVAAARGLNQDGEELLEAVQWKRRPVGEVVAALTEAAVTAEKLNLADAAGAVVVAVAPADGRKLAPEKADEIGELARTAITGALSDQGRKRSVTPRVQVPVLQVTEAEKEEAREAGLTPGQYLIMQQIRQAVPDVDPEELKNLGIGRLLQRLQLDPGEIFQKAQQQQHGSPKRGQQSQSAGSGTGVPATQGFRSSNGTDRSQDQSKNRNSFWERVWNQNRSRGSDQGQSDDRGRGRGRNPGSDRDGRVNGNQGGNDWDDRTSGQGSRAHRNDRGSGKDRSQQSRGQSGRGSGRDRNPYNVEDFNNRLNYPVKKGEVHSVSK